MSEGGIGHWLTTNQQTTERRHIHMFFFLLKNVSTAYSGMFCTAPFQ